MYIERRFKTLSGKVCVCVCVNLLMTLEKTVFTLNNYWKKTIPATGEKILLSCQVVGHWGLRVLRSSAHEETKTRRNEETKQWWNAETKKEETKKWRIAETKKRRNEEVKKRRSDSKNLEGRQTGQMEGHVSVAARNLSLTWCQPAVFYSIIGSGRLAVLTSTNYCPVVPTHRWHARPVLQDVWKNDTATQHRFTDELLDLYQQRHLYWHPGQLLEGVMPVDRLDLHDFQCGCICSQIIPMLFSCRMLRFHVHASPFHFHHLLWGGG